MIKFASIAIATIALGACSSTLPKCSAPNPKIIAKALYGQEQFRVMLIGIVKSTVTGKIVSKQDPDGFEKRLSVAADHAIARHGEQWDVNLAQAYSDTLSQRDLAKLCTAMNENDKRVFGRFADRVGLTMKARSTPLLETASAEVIKELFEGLPQS